MDSGEDLNDSSAQKKSHKLLGEHCVGSPLPCDVIKAWCRLSLFSQNDVNIAIRWNLERHAQLAVSGSERDGVVAAVCRQYGVFEAKCAIGILRYNAGAGGFGVCERATLVGIQCERGF